MATGYGFLRRRGLSPADAEDLTQGFFVRVLERRTFALADRERGRYRSFLLACPNHFVADEHGKARAERRGGGRPLLSLDFHAAEEGYYQAVSARTGLSPKDVAVAVHHLRRRFRKCVRDEVAGTLAIPEAVDEEMSHLQAAVRREPSPRDFRK